MDIFRCKTFKENRGNPKSEGLVIDMNERLFFYLGKISLFKLLRKNKRIKNMYNFVDMWVMGNLILSILLSFLIVKFLGDKITLTFSFIYATLRIFEIIIYQINVNLFDLYRNKLKNKNYSIKSPTRTVVLLIHNYIEIIFWYVIMIVSLLKFSNYPIIENFAFYVQSSFLCLATFNHDLIANISDGGYSILFNIAIFEVISGLIMTIISLANFIGRLPAKHKAEVEETKTVKT